MSEDADNKFEVNGRGWSATAEISKNNTVLSISSPDKQRVGFWGWVTRIFQFVTGFLGILTAGGAVIAVIAPDFARNTVSYLHAPAAFFFMDMEIQSGARGNWTVHYYRNKSLLLGVVDDALPDLTKVRTTEAPDVQAAAIKIVQNLNARYGNDAGNRAIATIPSDKGYFGRSPCEMDFCPSLDGKAKETVFLKQHSCLRIERFVMGPPNQSRYKVLKDGKFEDLMRDKPKLADCKRFYQSQSKSELGVCRPINIYLVGRKFACS